MHDKIELWNDIALIKDENYFTKWVKQAGKLAHHDGFLNYLRPFLGGVMLDVGANIGTHSIFYAEYGHVHCFEPNSIAFECLKHNLRNSDATLYNVAIGERATNVSMTSPEDGNYGAVYTQPGDDIPMLTIDSLELEDCDFIKIDVEGDEISVLRGAVNTIRKYKPTMCIECNPETLARRGYSPNDLIVALRVMGYITKTRVPEDISCDLLCEPVTK